MNRPSIAVIPLAALIVASGIVMAPGVGAAQNSSAPSPQPYRPGVGDLMTMTVQPRHIKLALAGRQKNWAYAKYELQQLEEALHRVVRTWPKWKGLPLGGVVDAISKGPIAAVSKAIADQNVGDFAAAFAQLTEGCNACHQAANVGMVVITVPEASSFPDQDLRPGKP